MAKGDLIQLSLSSLTTNLSASKSCVPD